MKKLDSYRTLPIHKDGIANPKHKSQKPWPLPTTRKLTVEVWRDEWTKKNPRGVRVKSACAPALGVNFCTDRSSSALRSRTVLNEVRTLSILVRERENEKKIMKVQYEYSKPHTTYAFPSESIHGSYGSYASRLNGLVRRFSCTCGMVWVPDRHSKFCEMTWGCRQRKHTKKPDVFKI